MAKRIEERPFSILDFNMGCPVPKVVNNGEGSALMRDPKLTEKLLTGLLIITPSARACGKFCLYGPFCRTYGLQYQSAIYYNNKNTEELLTIDPGEQPASLQLFGSDPEIGRMACNTKAPALYCWGFLRFLS